MQIENIFIVSLWCLGFWKAFDTEMIFAKLDEKYLQKLPEWLYKPTFGCTICFASIHGTIWFFILNDWTEWRWLLPFIVCVSGLNYILSSIIGRMSRNQK